jgi:hypothetical protein
MTNAIGATPQPSYLLPPRFIRPDESGYQGADARKIELVPSLAVLESGRIWATWYAGPAPAEDNNNYVVLATSDDRGQTWCERWIVDMHGDGKSRAYDPELWVDPVGRLWSFWNQSVLHEGKIAGVWGAVIQGADGDHPEPQQPRRLTDGVMMCKPTVLADGTWLLPVSIWRTMDFSARVVASADNGESFEVRGACNVPESERVYDEHMIVERGDGSLWMLVRINSGIGESFSRDGGRSWSALQMSSLGHPSSRFFIRRLASGRLLLVKHGKIGETLGRTNLTAFLSDDDGESWLGGLLLDDREEVSYPDGQQAADGVLYIAHDFSRTGAKEIMLSRFTEDDVLAGKIVSPQGQLRRRINSR